MRAFSVPRDFEKTLAAFPIVLEGSGANAPFTTLGGLNNTWVQGRRATRFFINDNLAWTVGSHELRFGTNTRIFRLNDFDFGQGGVPLVGYATLPQFIYGVASTASQNVYRGQFAAIQFSECRFLCAGYVEGHAGPDLDFRHARHVQFESSQSAQCRGATERIVRRRSLMT